MTKLPSKTAVSTANWFLARIDRDCGESITHLKLQKLIYYAQAWHLAVFKNPIFEEDLEAWAHGPVAPSVWKTYRDQRWEALPPPPRVPSLPEKTESLLEEVFSLYGSARAKQLESLTHSELPWIEARGDLPPEASCKNIISKKTMAEYYGKKLKEAQKKKPN